MQKELALISQYQSSDFKKGSRTYQLVVELALTVRLLVVGLFFISSGLAQADAIAYSNDIEERFAYKDWVSYKQTDLCRPMSEFIIGGSVASLAVFDKGPLWEQYESEPYRAFVYGEYVKSYRLRFNNELINSEQISESLLNQLANGSYVTIEAEIYSDYETHRTDKSKTFNATATISLSGSSAAFRYCGFIE
ncbi:hypothetical protein MED297_06948 [Reinekea sp. MED297]|uniref:Uncharacterized protein n=2 Tax=Reinekea TaxID=230494 RepID=A4BF86_9GAMM|nr:hypothetical protein MED297_06948 [Reinekea sp. MED297] [Reinekea blandensis MED297]